MFDALGTRLNRYAQPLAPATVAADPGDVAPLLEDRGTRTGPAATRSRA